jgi:amidase
MDELLWADATEQAERVRRGDVKPQELVEAAIGRIERLNPQLNAVVIPLFERGREEAASTTLPDGPFRGVPFLMKDLTCQIRGTPHHAGMRFLKELGWVSPDSTALGERFLRAGFVLLGKTNVPELGPVPSTEPVAYGPSHNPWDPGRSPGGSSGGSAAAVSSGMAAVAHGNDGGGSIRVPASACGLVGLKPTRGRVSLAPKLGESWHGLVAEHVLTRTVRDTAAILDAVSGPEVGDPYYAPLPARPFRDEVGVPPETLRVGLLTTAPDDSEVHAECVEAVEETGRVLARLGHQVAVSSPSALGDEGSGQAIVAVICAWTARDLDFWSHATGREIGPDDVEPYTWALAEQGRGLSAPDYIAATLTLERYSRALCSWWEGYDLLITPTMPELPTTLGELQSTRENPLGPLYRSGPVVTFTAPFNVTGQPAISLPMHWSAEGLPVGVQLVAPYAREDLLIRVASQLEQARPWRDRRPGISA